MALVKGTNCGFVTVAPSTDPTESTTTVDNLSNALKDTAPTGAIKVTEIGWWCDNATEESNFEVGIYEHNVGDDNPEAAVSRDQTNAKGTSGGWKKVTGLNIPITAGTIYWLAFQVDNTSTTTSTNIKAEGGEKRDEKSFSNSLANPWGTSSGTDVELLAIYALVEISEEGGQDGPYVY